MAHKTTTWGGNTAADTVAVAEGDIFKPLRLLRDKYLAKAAKLEKQGHDAVFYLRAAASIANLIPNRYEEALAQ